MNTKEYKVLIRDFINDKMMDEGYKKITLEEITSNLAISKKTVYKVFSSKEEIARSIFIGELTKAYQRLIQLIQEKSSMAMKIENLGEMIESYIRLFNDSSLHNLKKEYPNLWKEIVFFRKERVIPLINLLLNHSKKHDLIVDYPNELIIKLFSTSLTISTEKSYLVHNKSDCQTVFQSIFDILLDGILTKKGKKLLAINKRMNDENN
ncbi:MAG: transcriptional regulator [Ignavibacteria bacterium]|nr:MAG: transcriptional regulator [Ignavibacteria bacterium]KAF0154059.1 MAG: transcriptional regulator [Ignavibacteria bacterium]